MIRTSLFLTIIALATFSSCTLLPCTKVGCVDGLVVNMELDAQTEAVIILNGADGQSQTITCGGEEDDCQFAVFDAFPVKYYEATITRSNGTIQSRAETVFYTTVYPNGKRCDAECRQASITIAD